MAGRRQINLNGPEALGSLTDLGASSLSMPAPNNMA